MNITECKLLIEKKALRNVTRFIELCNNFVNDEELKDNLKAFNKMNFLDKLQNVYIKLLLDNECFDETVEKFINSTIKGRSSKYGYKLESYSIKSFEEVRRNGFNSVIPENVPINDASYLIISYSNASFENKLFLLYILNLYFTRHNWKMGFKSNKVMAVNNSLVHRKLPMYDSIPGFKPSF